MGVRIVSVSPGFTATATDAVHGTDVLVDGGMHCLSKAFLFNL